MRMYTEDSYRCTRGGYAPLPAAADFCSTERVDFQMRMVFREYASQVQTMRRIEARIARYNTLEEPVPDDLVEVDQRQRETSIIIAFKFQALGLLKSADMIDDKEFVCHVGLVPSSVYNWCIAGFRVSACY